MLNAYIVVVLIAVLVGIFLDARRRMWRHSRSLAAEKASIVSDSGATASIGVFHSPGDVSVILAASEERGALYYRVLRKGKVLNRSRINLANVVKTELLVDLTVRDPGPYSPQMPSAHVATEVSSREVAKCSPEQLRALQRVGVRIIFQDNGGQTKAFETTVMRADHDTHRSRRAELFKDAIWWTVFLNSASAKARKGQQGS
ncbi:MAG: thioredoxin [Desulfovibrio sp.]|nr:thioredoxin [Desulfovibrio sp.]